MPSEVKSEADLSSIGTPVKVFSVAELLALDIPPPSMLVEHVLPAASATLLVGASKNGKTLFAVQTGIAVASGRPLCGYYPIVQPGPVLVIEQDDPRGAASVKDILSHSPIPVHGIPFSLIEKVPFCFGLEFIEWLEAEIRHRKLKPCILDSYTKLRGPRKPGIDIVKAEENDLSMLDELATRSSCALEIIHHESGAGSARPHWTQRAGATFAMQMATEAQIHVSRFSDLNPNAPERLVRIRGRHLKDHEALLRFRVDTLDYEHVLEGGAAEMYPVVFRIQNTFEGKTFTPKELTHGTGVSHATAHRQINRLLEAGVLTKCGYGQYRLDRSVADDTRDK